MRSKGRFRRNVLTAFYRRALQTLAILAFATAVGVQGLQAQTLSALFAFSGANGAKPQGDLLRDTAGNLYGTAANGGSGHGLVFKVSSAGKETILHTFTGGADGGLPEAGLVRAPSGEFYSTAYSGGVSGHGVVFKLLGTALTVVHSFSGLDGSHPAAALVRDHAGNLYGTTFYGGTASCSCGTVFKIDLTGAETVLYSFTGGADGKFPAGRLLLDSTGNLYGTTSAGGTVNCGRFASKGCGVVFMVNPRGDEIVIYPFSGKADGGQPMAGLLGDSAGNLYGTAFSAGDLSKNCALNNGCGVVFRVSKTGQEAVLYTFTNSSDGANPVSDLVRDSAGNFYGTTKLGGLGYGVVFEMTGVGAETVLHEFTGNGDGAGPLAGLIRDASGDLYGTAALGGDGEGVVFKLVP